MEDAMRKVKNLQLTQEKLTRQKEAAIQRLVSLQQQFDEKDREYQDCDQRYRQAKQNLGSRRRQRDDLRKQVDMCTKGLSGMVKDVMNQSSMTAYKKEELGMNYHIAERDAARGYSCSKHS